MANKILGLPVVLMVVLLLIAPCVHSVAQASSATNSESLAMQFLEQVARYNSSQIALSTASPSVMSHSNHIPHFETDVLANVSGYNSGKALLTFIDGNFSSYSTGAVLAGNKQGFNETMEVLAEATNACYSLFNDSYWNDFSQLALISLQTQNLTVENGDFQLQIKNDSSVFAGFYNKTDLQYNVTIGLDMRISNTGQVIGADDHMMYYVATTNVTVSEAQALDVASQYTQAYAQQNQQKVMATNATIMYVQDVLGMRGDIFAIYPEWGVTAYYDKQSQDNYTAWSYTVNIWADNGEINSEGPNGLMGSSQTTSMPPNAPFLLIPIFATFAFILSIYTYRKSRFC